MVSLFHVFPPFQIESSSEKNVQLISREDFDKIKSGSSSRRPQGTDKRLAEKKAAAAAPKAQDGKDGKQQQQQNRQQQQATKQNDDATTKKPAAENASAAAGGPGMLDTFEEECQEDLDDLLFAEGGGRGGGRGGASSRASGRGHHNKVKGHLRFYPVTKDPSHHSQDEPRKRKTRHSVNPPVENHVGWIMGSGAAGGAAAAQQQQGEQQPCGSSQSHSRGIQIQQQQQHSSGESPSVAGSLGSRWAN